MGLIRQFNKSNKVAYLYDSTSWWVPEIQQSRAKRVLIGKLDPVTGQVLSTRRYLEENPQPSMVYGEPGATVVESEDDASVQAVLQARLMEETEKNRALERTVQDLQQEIMRLKDLNRTMSAIMQQISNLSGFVNTLGQDN